MKLTMTVLALALAFAAGNAGAADPSPAKTLSPQQQKMKDCNAQATGKSGDERRAFMSTCLKGGAAKTPAAKAASAPQPAAAPTAAGAGTIPAKSMTKQEKTKACAAQAAGKTGDERKAFVSACRRGNVAAR